MILMIIIFVYELNLVISLIRMNNVLYTMIKFNIFIVVKIINNVSNALVVRIIHAGIITFMLSLSFDYVVVNGSCSSSSLSLTSSHFCPLCSRLLE